MIRTLYAAQPVISSLMLAKCAALHQKSSSNVAALAPATRADLASALAPATAAEPP